MQAQVGTIENRLSYAISLAQSQVVNNTAAESRIRDANVAEEASNLAKFSILTQAGIAALAQANQSSAAVCRSFASPFVVTTGGGAQGPTPDSPLRILA